MDRLLLGPGAARLLRAVAVLGIATGLLVALLGQLLIGRVESALDSSLGLSADSLDAVDASIDVAEGSLAAVGAGLAEVEATATALDTSLRDFQGLLGATADLTRTDLADGLAAVEEALPTLVQVAGTIDTSLSTLSLLPFGPDYAPAEPFDRSLARVQDAIDGLPEQLREQADLIEASGEGLDDVADGVGALAGDLADLEAQLSDALAVLATYAGTADEGRALVADAQRDLQRQTLLTRLLALLLGVTIALGQVVPLHLAARIGAAGRAAAQD